MSTIKNRTEKDTFSMSAMIDVVFLLLIFFVVTYAPVSVEAHLAVHQPSTTGGESRPSLETEVHPNGYWFMGRPMSLAQVEGELMSAAAVGNDTPIFIKVNPKANEGQLIDLLDRCKKINLHNLNIHTLKANCGRPSVQ